MTKFGNFLWYTRIIFVYGNGDGYGFVWNWFNPLSWILSVLTLVAYVLLEGVINVKGSLHYIGFGMNPYFKSYPEELVWLKPGELSPKAQRRREELLKAGYNEDEI